jgi:hypothetical protein
MKVLKALAAISLLFIRYADVSAQTVPINEPDRNKPQLFSDLPQKLTVRLDDIDASLNEAVGKNVAIHLATGFVMQGVVISKSDGLDPNVKSIVVRSSNRVGATCTLTKVMNSDGSVTYRGRIMGMHNGDAYELTNDNGTYTLTKKNLYDLFNE